MLFSCCFVQFHKIIHFIALCAVTCFEIRVCKLCITNQQPVRNYSAIVASVHNNNCHVSINISNFHLKPLCSSLRSLLPSQMRAHLDFGQLSAICFRIWSDFHCKQTSTCCYKFCLLMFKVLSFLCWLMFICAMNHEPWTKAFLPVIFVQHPHHPHHPMS